MSRAYTEEEYAQGLADLRRYVAAATRGRIPPMSMVKRNQVNTDMIAAAKVMPGANADRDKSNSELTNQAEVAVVTLVPLAPGRLPGYRK